MSDRGSNRSINQGLNTNSSFTSPNIGHNGSFTSPANMSSIHRDPSVAYSETDVGSPRVPLSAAVGQDPASPVGGANFGNPTASQRRQAAIAGDTADPGSMSPFASRARYSMEPSDDSPSQPKKKERKAVLGEEPPAFPTRTYQAETTVLAMKVMEKELMGYVKSVPFRQIPTYKGVAETAKPACQTENPAKGETYNRSALARSVLERLAADIHGPMEEARVLHDYSTFHKVLSAPMADQLDKLDPTVQLRVEPQKRPAIVPPGLQKPLFDQPPPDMSSSSTGGGILKKASNFPVPPTGFRNSQAEDSMSRKTPEKDEQKKKKMQKPTKYVLDTWSRDPLRRGECLLYTSPGLKEQQRAANSELFF